MRIEECCYSPHISLDKTEQINALAASFKILADPIRLKILYLIRNKEICVCHITSALKLSQSKVSYHLKILTEAGLIKRRTQWCWSYYSLSEDFDKWFLENTSLLTLLNGEE
ncbi:MAG: metalloregulator ArsR/SmtB family transcription factor [Bacillota bacterium]